MSVKWASFTLNDNVTATSATSREVLYTATNGIAEVNHATVKNMSSSTAYDVFIYIKTDSTISGTLQEIEKINVGADTTVTLSKLISHRVPSGGTIQAHVSSGSDCYITISGDERQQ